MIQRVILSAGGTGGHIFPAIAVANEIKKRNPSVEILFVGAEGRMEMQKVPEAGYPIKGLWIAGFQRSLDWRNLLLPFKIVSSLLAARKIIKSFNPEIVVGFGGYASAAVLTAASLSRIPTVIQEQNSSAGITNKILGRWVKKVCVAYDGMDLSFPKHKIVKTGNPIREDLKTIAYSPQKAREKIGFKEEGPMVLVMGGSLGARAINEAIAALLPKFEESNYNLLWQTGNTQIEKYKPYESTRVKIVPFINNMALCYNAADLVVCRAGALTLSELTALGKPSILIPSPYVAEDHQTRNAVQLFNNQACMFLTENECMEALPTVLFGCIENKDVLEKIGKSAKKMALPHATESIVDELEKTLQMDKK
jgi:UDP-N-acetylglucosamine--N-acetylmuramyl-(pentapeptide) pyrophosphoryl-undecaprenol N-acetylglucosamine transferase